MEIEIVETRKWGNSSGALLPREWLGKQVKIILIDRTLEIRREILNILEQYLIDIMGIYLTGSYARNEQMTDSDIDIIVISKETRKTFSSGKYNIEIYPLKSIKKSLEENPILIYPRLLEAKPILNNFLLEELKNIKLGSNPWKNYIRECERIARINKEFIKLDEDKKEIQSQGIVYSLILRLRGLYLIEKIENRSFSKNSFQKWLAKKASLSKEDVESVYNIYKMEKNGEKINILIETKIAENLLNMFKKEISKYEKRKKT